MPMGIGPGLSVTRGGSVTGIGAIGADLALWFDENQAYKSSGGGIVTPDSILTYTAPSPKLVYGSDGVLRYAPHNLVLRSEEFDNAYWTKNSGGISANAVAAPDGTTTADKLIGVASATQQWVYRTTSITVGNGVAHTVSCYMKADGYNFGQLRIVTGGTNANVGFNLSTGTIYSTASGSGTITNVGGGWYRCTATGVSDSTSAQVYINVSDTASLSKSFAGDGTSGILIWGAQLNLGSSALTYIPTTTAAVYSLPRDYNPTTGAALGVLVEEARTNLLTYSEQFDNAAWLVANLVTPAADTAVAPTGTTIAEKLAPNASAAIHAIYRSSITVTASTPYTLSLYAKADGYDYIALMYHNGASTPGNETIQLFNLATGAIASSYNTAPTSAKIEPVGNRWYRVSITKDWATTSGNISIAPMNADAGPRTSFFSGNSVLGVLVYGAQLEAGAFATSLIPTQASQVTRAADQVSILTSAFPYSQTEMTIVSEYRQLVATTVSIPRTQVACVIDSGNNRLAIRGADSGNGATAAYGTGASVAGLGAASAVSANTLTKLAFAAGASLGGALYQNGAPAATSPTSASAPNVSTGTFGIGYAPALTSQLNGHIKRLAYYASRKTNAELVVLST